MKKILIAMMISAALIFSASSMAQQEHRYEHNTSSHSERHLDHDRDRGHMRGDYRHDGYRYGYHNGNYGRFDGFGDFVAGAIIGGMFIDATSPGYVTQSSGVIYSTPSNYVRVPRYCIDQFNTEFVCGYQWVAPPLTPDGD